jgi:hypothetical protein
MARQIRLDEDQTEDLKREKAELQAEVEQLKERLIEATEAVEAMAQGDPQKPRHEAHILVLALLLVARIAILQFAPAPDWAVTAANVIFGLLGVVVFATWCREAWDKERWWMTPRVIVIMAGLFIAASFCTNGTWKVSGATKDGALPAAGVLLVFLLVAASPICQVSIKGILDFMDHPVGYFKK